MGSGPAGYTAALYTSRADLDPLVVEGFAWGGLLQQTTYVENYPGYPDGVLGPQMMQDFRDQAERFGARFVTDDATKIDFAVGPGGTHVVHVGDQEIRTRAVILAMGADVLGIEGDAVGSVHRHLRVAQQEPVGGARLHVGHERDVVAVRPADGGGDRLEHVGHEG